MEGKTRTMVIDTCTVGLSTVLLDSVITSGGRRILVGTHRSEVYGSSRVEPYLTFRLADGFEQSGDPLTRPRLRFDSLTLLLPYAPDWSGDTTARMSLEVHRLSQRVELDEQSRLYAHSRFSYAPEPLATVDFQPRPRSGRTLEIRLPDALGQEFLDKFQHEDPEMEDDEAFQRYFRGLVLRPGGDARTQLAFADSSLDTLCRMRLHYSILREERVERQLDFPLNRSLLFHGVESDRTGTPFEELTHKNNQLSSPKSEDISLFHSLSGAYTRIDFPYLNNLEALGDHHYVISAELLVHPLGAEGGHAVRRDLPDSVKLYANSMLNSPSAFPPTSDVQTGRFFYDPESLSNTYYAWDLSSYIASLLGKTGDKSSYLCLMGTDYGHTLESLLIGDQRLDETNVKLQITYSIYNE